MGLVRDGIPMILVSGLMAVMAIGMERIEAPEARVVAAAAAEAASTPASNTAVFVHTATEPPSARVIGRLYDRAQSDEETIADRDTSVTELIDALDDRTAMLCQLRAAMETAPPADMRTDVSAYVSSHLDPRACAEPALRLHASPGP